MITVISVGGNNLNMVSIAQTNYTDLAIGAAPTQVTSAAQPFTSANVGESLVIAAGTGFTPGSYDIMGVSGVIALLDRPCGTVGSTAGVGTVGGGPGLRQVEFTISDAVAGATSMFTGQSQMQQWLGADLLSGVMTLPPMGQGDADTWIAYLMECRGMANVFQLGDPAKKMPRGTGGTATASGAQVAGSQTLATSFGAGALLVGDYLQIGYRMYRALEATDGSDAIGIWPSLREALAGGETITTANPLGLFRMASNKRTWSADYTKLSRISFQVQEYR